MFAPVIAFLATFSTGIAMNLVGGFAVDRLLMVLCESLVAGGFAYFSTATVRVIADAGNRTSLTAQEQSSLVATGAVLLMAVSSLEISGISPGRILAVVLILLLARCGREQGGSIAGIVLGLAMAMAARIHASRRRVCFRRLDGGNLFAVWPSGVGGDFCRHECDCRHERRQRRVGDYRSV